MTGPVTTQKVRTFLWFDHQAEEAARFYVSLFKDSRIISVSPGPTGAALVVEFELVGTQYLALNGGSHYQLTPAVSLSVDCADQAEVDQFWEKLTAGGTAIQCGWLTDKFGLSWQVVPSVLPKLLTDPVRGGAVMQAMLPMTKLDIQTLQDAFDGK